MLLHAADTGAPVPVRNVRDVHPADGDCPRLRSVQPQQQLKHRALSDSRPAHQRHLLPLLHRHGEVGEHVAFPIAEGHMGEHHIATGLLPLRRNVSLRLGQKGIDAANARHGRLDGLYLHAKALDGGENAGDIADDRHRRTHGHSKQGQQLCVAGGGEQHDCPHHHGVQQQHHRRIDGVIEVGAFHGGIAVTDAPVIAALHVVLQSQRTDGADIVQCLRHLPGHGSHGVAVIQLRRQHPFLHVAGEHGQQRQHQQQNQRQTSVLHGNDSQNGEDAAGVRHHTDDAGGEQRLHGIHIAGKSGGHLTGVLVHQCGRRQLRQLPGHLSAQGMGHFLPEQHQQALLRRGQDTLQRQTAEVEQRRQKAQGKSSCQPVDDAGQHQRRQKRRRHRGCHT